MPQIRKSLWFAAPRSQKSHVALIACRRNASSNFRRNLRHDGASRGTKASRWKIARSEQLTLLQDSVDDVLNHKARVVDQSARALAAISSKCIDRAGIKW